MRKSQNLHSIQKSHIYGESQSEINLLDMAERNKLNLQNGE